MGIKEALGGISLAEAERNIADHFDRFVMAVHPPTELEDGIWCTNHWRGRQPWPCQDYEDAALRKRDRDRGA